MANANPTVGYLINLAAGTYTLTAPLNYNQTTGRLLLRGNTAAPGNYIISGGSTSQLLTASGSGFLSIWGVTLQNGHSTNSPISISGNVSVQLNVDYIKNNISNQFGGAITLSGSASLQVFYTAFSGNTNDQYRTTSIYQGMTSFGGAITIIDTANALFREVSFTQNTAAMGGAIAISGSAGVTLQNCTIANNQAMTAGGGIFVSGSPSVNLSFNTISQNTAGVVPIGSTFPNFGGGIALDTFTGYLQTAGNVIAQNSLTKPSPGVGAKMGTDCFEGTYNRVNGTLTVQPFSGGAADAYPNFVGDVTSCPLQGDNSSATYGTAAAPANPKLGALTSLPSKFGTINLQVFPILAGSILLSSTAIAGVANAGGYISDSEDCNTATPGWDCPPQFDELNDTRPHFQSAVINGVTYPGVGQADFGAYQPPGQ
jgi:hypothetical protein